jgi:hypothetical protein
MVQRAQRPAEGSEIPNAEILSLCAAQHRQRQRSRSRHREREHACVAAEEGRVPGEASWR